MNPYFSRSAAAIVAAVVVVVAPAGVTRIDQASAKSAAQAADGSRDHHRDSRGDVVYTVGTDYDGQRPARSNKSADIHQFDSDYSESRVSMTVVVGRLTQHRFSLDSRIAVPGTAEYDLEVDATDSASLDLTLTRLTKNSNDTVDCPGVTATLRPSRNAVSVAVPATCLRNPVWVRTGLRYAVHLSETNRDFLDDARAGDFPGHRAKLGSILRP